MKKAEFKTKIEDSFSDFFENQTPHDYAALQNFDNNTTLSKSGKEDFALALKPWTNFLKQAFLFFPGTFLLFYISLATAFLLSDILAAPARNLPFSSEMIFIYLLGVVAVFMTWSGLGEIKNKKHFIIPASIIGSGLILGALVAAADGFFWIAQKIIDDFGYAIYLFPIALIVPFLAKGWVDRKTA